MNRTANSPVNVQSAANSRNALLAVSLPHLDSEAEMRKFFGAKVVCSLSNLVPSGTIHDCSPLQIRASKAETKSPRGSAAALQGLKSNLTKPQPSWWSASQREGLSIRGLTEDEVATKEQHLGFKVQDRNEKWWTVEYSQKYRSVTKAFMAATMSGGKLDHSIVYLGLSKPSQIRSSFGAFCRSCLGMPTHYSKRRKYIDIGTVGRPSIFYARFC